MKTRTLFSVMGVNVQLTQPGVISTVGLWLIFTLASWRLLSLTIIEALIAGAAATFLHWLSEFLHQMGHALAARRVGYPMQRIRMWYVLAAGLYPKDEPALPAEIHIKRAVGGPAASLVLSVIGLLLVGVTRPFGETLYYLALFFTLENFFVFFIGALIPLGFNDGSTLLTWWPKRGQTPLSDDR